MANDVAFHPLAFSDLEALDDFIARDSPERAASFVGRIRQFCESLAEFPERGRLREDFGAGIRTLSFDAGLSSLTDSSVVPLLSCAFSMRARTMARSLSRERSIL